MALIKAATAMPIRTTPPATTVTITTAGAVVLDPLSFVVALVTFVTIGVVTMKVATVDDVANVEDVATVEDVANVDDVATVEDGMVVLVKADVAYCSVESYSLRMLCPL